MKLWKGIEIEGKYKGIKTLFVGDKSISFDEIVNIIKDDNQIKQIYFGAGKCTEINEDVLMDCVFQFNNTYILTAEIDIKNLHNYDIKLLKSINTIITLTDKNFTLIKELYLNKVYLKIQTLDPDDKKFLSVGEYINFIETNMETHIDKTYKGDEVIR